MNAAMELAKPQTIRDDRLATTRVRPLSAFADIDYALADRCTDPYITAERRRRLIRECVTGAV